MPSHITKPQRTTYGLLLAILLLLASIEIVSFYLDEFHNLFINQKSPLARLFLPTTYLGICLLTQLSFGLLSFSRSLLPRILSYILLIPIVTDIVIHHILASRITVDILVLFLHEARLAGDAIVFYHRTILVALAAFLALVVAKETLLRHFHIIPNPFSLGLLAASLLLGVLLLSKTDGRRDAFNAAIRVPAQFLYLTFHGQSHGMFLPYQVRQLESSIQPSPERRLDKLVLLLDESITGTFLFKTYHGAEITPFLRQFSDRLLNFGCANSVSNSSQQTGYVLRNGLTSSTLPDLEHASFSMPSIFTFAKRAGYTTILIDTQMRSVRRLQNLASFHDLEDVDEYIVSSQDTPIVDRDQATIALVKDLLEQHQRIFIWVTKTGAHFAYNRRYPRSQAVFRPDEYQATSHDRLDRVTANDSQPLLNSYLNAIRWNVDTYFERFAAAIDLSTVSVIYTSDHGQSLFGGSNATHGRAIDPPMTQANVPLLVFGEPIRRRFAGPIEENKYSQFQVFPTLLGAMGFDEEVVAPYGRPLWRGPVAGQRRFLSGSMFSDNFAWNDFDGDCGLDLPP